MAQNRRDFLTPPVHVLWSISCYTQATLPRRRRPKSSRERRASRVVSAFCFRSLLLSPLSPSLSSLLLSPSLSFSLSRRNNTLTAASTHPIVEFPIIFCLTAKKQGHQEWERASDTAQFFLPSFLSLSILDDGVCSRDCL